MKSHQSKYIMVTLVLIIMILAALLVDAKHDLQQEVSQQQEDHKHNRQLVGSTRMWGGSNGEMVSYNLRSFDGGRTWVSVSYDEDWRMKVEGDVNVLYPGLVENVRGMQTLIDLGNQNGLINISTPTNQMALRQAGFDIK